MNSELIANLKAALEHSPENVPLRALLAEKLTESGLFEEAENEFKQLIAISNDPQFQYGLAKVYFDQKKYSTCNVVLEQLIKINTPQKEYLVLHVRALLKEDLFDRAQSVYQQLLSIYPDYVNEDLDLQFRVPNELQTDDNNTENSIFIDKPNINFNDIGGMENVKKEIDLKIIQPLLHPDLYKAYGKKAGGGILLYGPPGCGKTFIAKATAGQANAKFISVELTDILDMWIGNSEKNLHSLFAIARNNKPCVIFIDEIDALGANRNDMKISGNRNLINQFLVELDGINSENEGILIIGATNAPWHMDPAFRRPGRFDRVLFVPPPDQASRQRILELKLQEKPLGVVDSKLLSTKMDNYSGADIQAVVDRAIENKIEVSLSTGKIHPIETKDLIDAMKSHTPSTQEWFVFAKNYAVFANESGLYDDVLRYIKSK